MSLEDRLYELAKKIYQVTEIEFDILDDNSTEEVYKLIDLSEDDLNGLKANILEFRTLAEEYLKN